MARYVFKLPDIGEGIAEAEIAAWRVAVGERIEEDQPLVDMMTDKATVELSSPVGGQVVALAGAAGDMIPVGAELVVVETNAAQPGAPEPDSGRATAATAAPPGAAPAEALAVATVEPAAAAQLAEAPPSDAATGATPQAPIVPGRAPAAIPQGLAEAKRRPLAAPAVRQRAKDLGINLAEVHSSHPSGRIRHADLDAHLAYTRQPAAGQATPDASGRQGVTATRVIGLRRRIAEKMQDAKRRIPHFAYVEEVDVTELEALRRHLNTAHAGSRPKLTLLPFLITAMVRTLPRFPQINARFDDEAGIVNRFDAVHVGVATQTAAGLVVPVLRHAEVRDLWNQAAEIARLADAARNGKAAPDELRGSTITITSLGALGGIVTTPVINHPEVAIIGVNKMVDRPVVRNGTIAVRTVMNLSSCFDHRVVDGYDAAEFVQAIKTLLEHPATLFIA